MVDVAEPFAEREGEVEVEGEEAVRTRFGVPGGGGDLGVVGAHLRCLALRERAVVLEGVKWPWRIVAWVVDVLEDACTPVVFLIGDAVCDYGRAGVR